MSRAGKAFELGGLVVPITAGLALQQRIEPIGGTALLRLADGGAVKQTTWRRRRVTLSADGWTPPGLAALDFDGPLTLKCGLPTAITTQALVLALPAGRRTDAGYAPFARAHLPSGEQRDTAIALAGNGATLTAVPGAVAYSVWYWPQLTVHAEPPAESFDGSGAVVAWELVAEEA